jgi:hypothetical protein
MVNHVFQAIGYEMEERGKLLTSCMSGLQAHTKDM